MVSDHTVAAEKLKQVLSEQHLTTPSDKPDAKRKAVLEDLNGRLDAKSFGRLANDMLPTLEAHLQAVEKVR